MITSALNNTNYLDIIDEDEKTTMAIHHYDPGRFTIE